MSTEEDFFSAMSGHELPKPRLNVNLPNLGRFTAGAARAGSNTAGLALIDGVVVYLILQTFIFTKPPFNQASPSTLSIGQFSFSIFVGAAFGFFAIAVLGNRIGQMKSSLAKILFLGFFVWFGISVGPWLLLQVAGGSITGPYPMLALASPTGTIGSYTLPFGFFINGVDYTWLFLLLIVLVVYYSLDDWRLWIHGHFPL